MKITKTKLKQIIEEELGRVLGENLDPNVAKIMDRIVYTVADLAAEERSAKWIFNNLKGSDAIDGLNASDANLQAAIANLLKLGPPESEDLTMQQYL
tara:strand:- start:23 stop:313 length:291 start_codon:yes stop_codon:yes gene_type:complete